MNLGQGSALLLVSEEVPSEWRRRAVRAWLVPLATGEESRILGRHPERTPIEPGDEPVARLVAGGMPAKAIANELGLTTRAVYRRLARLRERLGVGSIPELVSELSGRGYAGRSDKD